MDDARHSACLLPRRRAAQADHARAATGHRTLFVTDWPAQKRHAVHFSFFFSRFAARFSSAVLVGAFFLSFFWFRPLLIVMSCCG